MINKFATFYLSLCSENYLLFERWDKYLTLQCFEIIDYLKKQTRKYDNKFTTFVKYRAEELMALYAEVKRLKNENEELTLAKFKLIKELHDRKTND